MHAWRLTACPTSALGCIMYMELDRCQAGALCSCYHLFLPQWSSSHCSHLLAIQAPNSGAFLVSSLLFITHIWSVGNSYWLCFYYLPRIWPLLINSAVITQVQPTMNFFLAYQNSILTGPSALSLSLPPLLYCQQNGLGELWKIKGR